MRTRTGVSGLDVDALYARHRDELLRWFVRRTADTQTALDLWAETFAQAVASSHRFRGSGPDAEAAWIYTIAKRQLALYHRRGNAQLRALQRLGIERPEADEALIAEIERRADLDTLRRTVAAALATLSDPVREAVELRVVSDLGYREVSERLQITEVAARARVSRGLLALADVIDETTLKEALSP
jgi:RNA polymerase sigma factor (sigma-70 family)